MWPDLLCCAEFPDRVDILCEYLALGGAQDVQVDVLETCLVAEAIGQSRTVKISIFRQPLQFGKLIKFGCLFNLTLYKL